MNIVITCNIDAYKHNCFTSLEQVPRVGDLVAVTKLFNPYFQGKRLPLLLEVKQVIWHENGHVEVNVHYTKTTIESAIISGVNLYP